MFSHPSFTEPGSMLVRVLADGVDIAINGLSRGQALDQLADHFMNLSRAVRMAAWAPDVNNINTPAPPKTENR